MHRALEFIVALALLGGPGYLAAHSLARRGERCASGLATMLGVGCAGIPLTWLIAGYLRLPALLLWGVVVLAVVGMSVLALLRGHFSLPRRSEWITGGVLLVGAVWRLAQISGWAFPAWVDSVHHALIIRQLLETGRLPVDLTPYLQLPFFYHFGYHSLVAACCQLTGLAIPEGMLVVGQLLQVGTLLSVYRLGKVLWEGHWAVLAALLVAFISTLPGRYTAWGKYPLLTATVLLPLVMAAGLELVARGATLRRTLWFSFTLAGTLITHYYAAFTLALFLALLFLTQLIRIQDEASPAILGPQGNLPARPALASSEAAKSGHAIRGAGALLPGAALSLILTAPWLWHVWSYAGQLSEVQVDPGLRPETAYFTGYLPYLWQLTGPGYNRVLGLLALPGLWLALQRRPLRPIALWMVLLVALAIPYGWKFSLSGPDRALILWWLPASLLATETIRAANHWLAGLPDQQEQGRIWLCRAGRVGLLVGLAILIGWGGIGSSTLPDTALAVSSDVPALAWVADHTPQAARFFISVTPWPPYGYRGLDGGWWITPLTGRPTLLPPALYGLGNSAEVERLNTLARQATAIGGCGPEFWDLVAQTGVTYLYFNVARSPLRPAGFDGCEAIEKVYERDGVFIYRLLWSEPADFVN